MSSQPHGQINRGVKGNGMLSARVRAANAEIQPGGAALTALLIFIASAGSRFETPYSESSVDFDYFARIGLPELLILT